jgi:biotin carboxylase
MRTEQAVLVIGSGEQQYREYALAAMAARAPLRLLDASPPTWQRGYVEGWHPVEPLTLGGMLAAGRAAAGQVPIAGVATYDERYVEAAALLAEELGLPGATAAAVHACKDKWETRRLLAADSGAIRARLATDEDEAVEAAKELGLPVVLKPRSLGGSIAVVRADEPDEVRRCFRVAASGTVGGLVLQHPGVVVEEYVEGPEFSIDSVVWQGRVTPVVLAAKTVGLEPYFEETGHVVDPFAAPVTAGLAAFLQRVHELLGFADGVTHTEYKATAEGFRLIEVNARLGGDLIPYLGLLTTGSDVAGAVADLAMGREPDLQVQAQQAAAVRFIYPDQDLELEAVDIPPELEHTGAAVRARPLAEPGEVLRLPPRGFMTRAAFVIVAGPDGAGCLRELDRLAPQVKLRGRPLGVD